MGALLPALTKKLINCSLISHSAIFLFVQVYGILILYVSWRKRFLRRDENEGGQHNRKYAGIVYRVRLWAL